MKRNVIPFRAKPRVFTEREQVVDAVREAIFRSGLPYRVIAASAGTGQSTIANLANGKTRWPRDTTLFPVMRAVGIGLSVVQL